jgi:hypothetical protein
MSKNRIPPEPNGRNVKPRTEGANLQPIDTGEVRAPTAPSGIDAPAPSSVTAAQRADQEADIEDRERTRDLQILINALTRELTAHQQRQRK